MDVCSREAKPLLTVADALARVLAAIEPMSLTESIGLDNALGRILGEPVFSPINLPYDRNAAMDGYALHSGDIGEQAFTLEVIGTSWAGEPFSGTLSRSQCVRIFTGAVVPKQADTVIMQEQVRVDGDSAIFPGRLKPRQNIREAGEDVREGELLLEPGKKLAAVDLALLAAAGISQVEVKKRPGIIFFSTGDELLPLGEAPSSGKIYDSNRYLLRGLLADAVYQVTDGGILPDDPQVLEETLANAAQAYDAIITTGGASVGEADYIKDLLTRLGRVDFWKIAIKPGKPMAFGAIGGCHFFGLPGNPVAVLVTFQQLVAPALRRLAGALASRPLRLKATCTTPLKKSPGREEFLRGILTQAEDGGLQVSANAKQSSHILSSLAAANCFIVLPVDCTGVAAGEPVIVELF